MVVPRLLFYCTSTLPKDKIPLQEGGLDPATGNGPWERGPCFFLDTSANFTDPLPPPRAPDGNGESECTCCISLHITLLL